MEDASCAYSGFSKAFIISFLMLSAFGFRPSLHKLFKSYMDDRTQCVKINDKVSSTMLVISGAPQGSVLGTLLCAIYINDLPDDRAFSDCFLFADDSKLLCAFLQLNSDLQADVTTFKNWAGQNLMKFITAKRRVVRFSSNPTWPLHITLNSEPITKTDYLRDLGVFIENPQIGT